MIPRFFDPHSNAMRPRRPSSRAACLYFSLSYLVLAISHPPVPCASIPSSGRWQSTANSDLLPEASHVAANNPFRALEISRTALPAANTPDFASRSDAHPEAVRASYHSFREALPPIGNPIGLAPVRCQLHGDHSPFAGVPAYTSPLGTLSYQDVLSHNSLWSPFSNRAEPSFGALVFRDTITSPYTFSRSCVRTC